MRKLLLSPALDDEFVTHLRLVEPDDAGFVAQSRSDVSLSRHEDLQPSWNGGDDKKKWIARYKVRESAGKELFLIVRNQMTSFGAIRCMIFAPDKVHSDGEAG